MTLQEALLGIDNFTASAVSNLPTAPDHRTHRTTEGVIVMKTMPAVLFGWKQTDLQGDDWLNRDKHDGRLSQRGIRTSGPIPIYARRTMCRQALVQIPTQETER